MNDLSFKPLGFNFKDCRKINQIKPFVIRSTSVYVPLENLIENSSIESKKITLIEFANVHNISIGDVNILLKNGINTVEELSTVGISYLKSLGLSDIHTILNAL